MGRGARQFYSSKGPASEPRSEIDGQKPSSDEDLDDLPERGSYEAPPKRLDFRKLLDDLDEDPYYEPGAPAAPAARRPLGLPYTTAPLRRGRFTREIEQPTEQESTEKSVHILGYDPRAFYIAHELAGYEFLDPVKLLLHKQILMNNWKYEGKRLILWEGAKRTFRDRVEAEWVGTGRMRRSDEHIKQLIVTLPCAATKSAIENIMHRIDHRTTICLIQDGLGVVEELNAALFPDPTSRPMYILGNMTASIGHYRKIFFSSILKKPGKLYLTALDRGVGLLPFFKFHPPIERQTNATQFLRTLVTTPNLGAGGYSLENFLIKKLPTMVFQSIIEPMSIVLDTTYDQILANQHAIELADELLDELFNVIWAIPELTNSSKVIEHCGKDALRKYTLKRLAGKGQAQSPFLGRVRAGRMVDIDYLNGYFVKRAKELGVKTPQNEMIIDVVKARVEERNTQMKGLIPFEHLSTTVPDSN